MFQQLKEILDPFEYSTNNDYVVFHRAKRSDRNLFINEPRVVSRPWPRVCSPCSPVLSLVRLKSNTNARGLDCFFFLGKRAEKGNRRKRIEGGQK